MQKRVRAILIDNGKIILIKRVKKDRVYYVFPGGGVEKGETLVQALQREMREELGVNVSVGKLFAKRPFNKPGSGIDQMEYFYSCKIVSGNLGTGDGPEYQPGGDYEGTREVVQLPLSTINELNLLPLDIRDLLIE